MSGSKKKSGSKKNLSGKPASGSSPLAATGTMPAALEAALAAHPRAREYFDSMPPSHRRAHVAHVAEAKKEETQARRAAQAIPMIVAWGEARQR